MMSIFVEYTVYLLTERQIVQFSLPEIIYHFYAYAFVMFFFFFLPYLTTLVSEMFFIILITDLNFYICFILTSPTCNSHLGLTILLINIHSTLDLFLYQLPCLIIQVFFLNPSVECYICNICCQGKFLESSCLTS